MITRHSGLDPESSKQTFLITRKRESPVIMLSLEDFQAMEETAYLLRSPANAKRLLESITELEAGEGMERDLIE